MEADTSTTKPCEVGGCHSRMKFTGKGETGWECVDKRKCHEDLQKRVAWATLAPAGDHAHL